MNISMTKHLLTVKQYPECDDAHMDEEEDSWRPT